MFEVRYDPGGGETPSLKTSQRKHVPVVQPAPHDAYAYAAGLSLPFHPHSTRTE